MTQLLKHYWINYDTGNYALYPARSYMVPNIEGLERIHDLSTLDNVPYSLSTVPDTTVIDESDGIWIITQQQWDNEIVEYDNRQEEKRYNLIREIRDEILSVTDWIVIKAKEQEEILIPEFTSWRQSLRNLPDGQTFPTGFPTLPTMLENNQKVLDLYDRWYQVVSIPMINDPLSVQ
jgi:hypothetical protein